MGDLVRGRFPNPAPRPIDEDENTIEILRKAIEGCVKRYGQNATKDMLLAAVGIADAHDWRARARSAFNGDKKS